VRHTAKVTTDSQLEVADKESNGTKMNDVELCLGVV